jgi:hypothetical protein
VLGGSPREYAQERGAADQHAPQLATRAASHQKTALTLTARRTRTHEAVFSLFRRSSITAAVSKTSNA